MTRRERELLAVAACTGLVVFPFAGQAFHIDEPFFLAIARHILSDPLHPLAFWYNWYGDAVPMASINNTPPLLGYLLAAELERGSTTAAATPLPGPVPQTPVVRRP